jgi:hypothetical protein
MTRVFEQLRPEQRQLMWLAYVEVRRTARLRRRWIARGQRPGAVARARRRLAALLGPRTAHAGERR